MENGQLYTKQLINLREKKDKNKSDIARILGIEIRNYTNYENGTREMPYDVLIAIADYYEVSTDYILGRTDVSKQYPPKKQKIIFQGGNHNINFNL